MIGENLQDIKDRQRRVAEKNILLNRERERKLAERNKHVLLGVLMLACLLAVAIPIIILVSQALRGR